jgi:hypothetical protein
MAEETIRREHTYHAESHSVSGSLKLPLAQEIEPQAHAKIPAIGGYLSQHAQSFRVEGIISYGEAHTQVSGHREIKPGRGFKTLASSVVENLNILNVITADRVVAQISTEHPLVGYVPQVSFLGTHFYNLRIAGHPVKLDLDVDIFGSKPDGDLPYTSDAGFIKRVSSQYERIRAHKDLPDDILKKYNQNPSASGRQVSIECSLVNQADGPHPGRSFGHVIHVPNFGTIYLATVLVEQSDFKEGTDIPRATTITLKMIDVKMGCIAEGNTGVSVLTTNGRTIP